LTKGIEIGGIERLRCRLQHADAPDLRARLRTAGEWHRKQAAAHYKNDRPPIHHWISRRIEASYQRYYASKRGFNPASQLTEAERVAKTEIDPLQPVTLQESGHSRT